MKFISGILIFLVFLIQIAKASEVEFVVNQVVTKDRRVFSFRSLKETTLGINSEGKIDVERLVTRGDEVLLRSDIDYVILVAKTPSMQIEDENEQNNVEQRALFMTLHAGWVTPTGCP